MLNEQIGAANPHQYKLARDAQNWRNPFVLLNADGSVTLASLTNGRQTIKVDELGTILTALPIGDWPYGRIIGVQPCSMGSGNAEKEAAQLAQTTYKHLRDLVRKLAIETYVYPTG